MKAAEDLKQQQVILTEPIIQCNCELKMLREQERQRILAERIIPLPDLDAMDECWCMIHMYFITFSGTYLFYLAGWQRVGKEFSDRSK